MFVSLYDLVLKLRTFSSAINLVLFVEYYSI